jgi:DNA-binding MarR family transcriptional regulator
MRTPSSEEIATRVWVAMHAFVAGQDRRKALREALDLGPLRVQLLVRLAEGPMTLREIALTVGVDPPAATVACDKLQARGLVKRTAHPDDNRRKLVRLTDAGRAAAALGQQILTRPPAALTELSADELAHLDAILTHLAPAPDDTPSREVFPPH